MNGQTGSKGGLANNFWLQIGILAIAVIVLIAFAAKYIW